MKLLKVKISGSVQGVFFRHSAKAKAEELGLKGFVQNEPVGSVYIEVEGEEKALQEFLSWCYMGPPLARIDKVDFEISERIGKFSKFEIK